MCSSVKIKKYYFFEESRFWGSEFRLFLFIRRNFSQFGVESEGWFGKKGTKKMAVVF
jgi:hypothetical protein